MFLTYTFILSIEEKMSYIIEPKRIKDNNLFLINNFSDINFV